MQALELTDDPAEQAALLEKAGNEETDIDAERGQSLFERAVVLYRSIGDLHGLARAAVGVSITMMLQQRPVDAGFTKQQWFDTDAAFDRVMGG